MGAENNILERLRELEEAIAYDRPPPDGLPPFAYTPGHLPILLSAPHGAAHQRDGRLKEEDEYTAAFARLTAAETGAHVLYAYARSDSDPNWDRDSLYKHVLGALVEARQIRFVLDIHGMSNRHKFGIALGTMHGRSCPRLEPLIIETLARQAFRRATVRETREFPALQWDHFVVNHHRFTGGVSSHTVTRFAVEELQVEAAQIELCASLRIVRRRNNGKWPPDFRGDPAGIVQSALGLKNLTLALAAAVGRQ